MAAAGLAALAAILPLPLAAQSWTASHQFPVGDPRDQALRRLADDLAGLGIAIRIFPQATLLSPRDQLSGLNNGTLDLALIPADYMIDRIPQIAVLSLPGVVRGLDHARRLNASGPMRDLHRRIEAAGAVVIGQSWAAGTIAGRRHCIVAPTDAAGLRARIIGPYYAELWGATGAVPVPVPTSEMLATLLDHGLIDIASTSVTTLLSARLRTRFACLTLPGAAGAIWYFYEPILLSRRAWEELDTERRQAVLDAGSRAGSALTANASRFERQLAGDYLAAGIEVRTLDPEALTAWQRLARRTSWKMFREQVAGGAEMIDRVLAVE
ncbi:TRAP transporter substrate-binding protein DctP [Magnetospirillum fulvum]|uniref:TRAP-type C4-dicarboxylate transport system, substrate-binding protein n=1 Tax=Magnetospirillum fulvum TaxID=1082 RepID=A0A1H6HGW7_MAGFU|nr:TRAP transporter substrate-binding protein DctP [Magnetospirillum fulvum]SEH34352.1 TRAP-type C4-dicarboxylate transport system, substrate-binding protein [Magnetospirillum fulvum]